MFRTFVYIIIACRAAECRHHCLGVLDGKKIRSAAVGILVFQSISVDVLGRLSPQQAQRQSPARSPLEGRRDPQGERHFD